VYPLTKCWIAEYRKESSRKVDLVIYLPIYERILRWICGFFEKPTPPALILKKGLTLISFHARHCLFNLLLETGKNKGREFMPSRPF
jgi:hypothetical protein